MSVYDLFRDTVPWQQVAGEPEYPGQAPTGPTEAIRVHDAGASIVQIAGDRVHRRIWWTLPEHAVAVGHTLDGHPVTELAGEVKDRAGNVRYRVWYGAL